MKIKGQLLRRKPYSVNRNGDNGVKIVLAELIGLNPGQRFFQYLQSDGCILLVPEELHEDLESEEKK